MAKKIDPRAFNALAQALAVIYWYKKPLERYLRSMLKDAHELIIRLDFEGSTKREVAGRLVDLLMENENRYQALIISLMTNVAEMETFPDLVSRDGHPDAEMIKKARLAVAEMKRWTVHHSSIANEHKNYAEQLAAATEKAAANRAHSQALLEIKERFFAQHKDGSNPQKRGKELEKIINELFALFDLAPRAAYSLEHEQIDGAFSFDTDDYILEARWWQEAIGREHFDVFAKKVERKGRNALGLCISISGFTRDALAMYDNSSPFITMDGLDFIAVLDERIRLDELLRHKKRHVNETGSCHLPISEIL